MPGEYNKSSLSLFSNKGATGNQPIMRGFVDIKPNELKWIAGELKAGRTGRLRVTVWKRTSQKTNTQFLSGVIEPEEAKPKNDFDIDAFNDAVSGPDDLIL